MKSWIFSKNIFVVLFYRIFLIMALLTVSRIGFYVFNRHMFPDIPFWQFIGILRGGFVFDISAVVYVNMLFILLSIVPFDIRYNEKYQKVLKYIFFITNGIALAGNGADYVYYRFLNKRATSDIFTTFENERHIEKMIFRFLIDYWPVTLFTLFLIFLMIYLYGKVKVQKPKPRKLVPYYAINIMMVFIVATLVVGAARGGYKYSTRPITISNAARYVKNPHDVPLVLNTPFSILMTLSVKELKIYQFYNDDELTKFYNPHYIPA
jgi:hypothetical protein